MKLAVIGTAGRGPDGARLNAGYWRSMTTVAQVVACTTGATHLVSGGAAVADHLAVALYLDGHVSSLTLHLPAEWVGHGFKETSSRFDCGRTSNHYHTLFSERTGVRSLIEIQAAIEKGARVVSGGGGFKARNTDIAMEADEVLAFTFGEGAVLKDGGTKDTMDKWLARRTKAAEEGRLDEVYDGPYAYHFDLSSKTLHRL